MEKLRERFQVVIDELLNKVQWPSLEELQSSTVTVLIASLLIAAVIALMDFVFDRSTGFLYGLF